MRLAPVEARPFAGRDPTSARAASLAELLKDDAYSYEAGFHGLFDCYAVRERSCTVCCCCTQCFCGLCGSLCTWTSMSGAMALPDAERVFAGGIVGNQVAQAGRNMRSAGNEAGGIVELVGLVLYAWARAVGRSGVQRWLGHRQVDSNLANCCLIFWCGPCATIQEVDGLATAYVQRQAEFGRRVDVRYNCSILPRQSCLCCFLEELDLVTGTTDELVSLVDGSGQVFEKPPKDVGFMPSLFVQ
jgi:hypothetical protein